ncbi:MAG: type II secretion system protein [Clostridia bacterium]|nr:type II secretion system protein [Clostridia bacterium]
MKLNKKGFGVAEIAIVVLLIGILAAAVIAGFMGIKKNANDVADEQGKIAQTMSNDLKHSFPIVLSDDQNGLIIKPGEYEVYDLNGNNLKDFKNSGIKTSDNIKVDNIYTIVNEGGDLFIKGSGGTIEFSKYAIRHPSGTNGTTTIENTILKINHSTVAGNYAMYIFGGTLNLHNVTFKSVQRGVAALYGAKINISADKDEYELTNNQSSTGGYVIYAAAEGTEVTIDGGLYRSIPKNMILCTEQATINVKNGTFKCKQNGNDNGADTRGMFMITTNGVINISGGLFDYSDAKKPENKFIVTFSGAGGTLNISGGEFVTEMKYKSGTGTIVITGGAFAVKPNAEWIPEGYSISAEKQPVVCRDGVTRNLWVVTKN